MKISFLVKSLTAVCATTLLVSALTYKIIKIDEPETINLAAFRNAAANIEFIRNKTERSSTVILPDVTGTIVNVIEKEVKAKIRQTRNSLRPKKIEERSVIAKNWDDIRPEFATIDMSIIEVRLNTNATTNAEISEYEINNKELINLYGFNVEALQYETFENIQIANIEEKTIPSDTTEDVVQVAQASTTTQLVEEIAPVVDAVEVSPEAIAASELATNENPINDELVVYDYSEKEKAALTESLPKMKKVFDSPISSTVKEAIDRASHKSPLIAANLNTQKNTNITKVIEESSLEKVMEDEDNLVFDYSNNGQAAPEKSAIIKKEAESTVSAFMSPPVSPDLTTQAEFIIQALEINMNTLKARQAYGFEFVPDYDRSERTDDQASGEIKIGYALSSNVNTQTGVVQSQGLIPTRVELNLLSKGLNIPMFNEEGLQKFLEKKQADVVGNLILVAIDPSISDVEIDSDHQFKLYLSEKFKLVDSQINASYVLFLGVRTGNISVRYLLSNSESAQKIVYVGEGEMYFENPSFIATQRELYTFTTRSLLGKKVKELNINGSEISFFGTKTTAKKKALNAYELKIPEMVDNTRKYLEFKHLGESLFVGTESTTEIEIPGKDFIGKVLQANDLSEIGTRCMVQVNITKDLRDIKASGKNKAGEMFVETTFLDNDGNFSRDNSELSEKVFVSGDMEGIFSVRLDYADGSTDFLKTFCSEGAYLIEQL